MRSRLLALALGVVVALASIEGGLRLLAWIAPALLDRSGGPIAGGLTILCVGDSNTYGVGVDPSQSYPARLEAILRGSPATHDARVINLGIPGSSSTQVRQRLPEYLEIYSPDVVIVLVGVNDYWSRIDLERDPTPAVASGAPRGVWASLHARLMDSRLHRLILLTANAFAPEPEAPRLNTRLKRMGEGPKSAIASHVVWIGDRRFVVDDLRRETNLSRAEYRALLAANLVEIRKVAAAAGIPILLPTYASPRSWYAVANEVIARQPDDLVVRQRVDTDLARYLTMSASGDDTSELFFPDLHPRPPVYDAFARSLCDALVRRGLVPSVPCSVAPLR